MSQPRLVINESAESIGMTDLKHALEAGQPLIMLDVRERAAFVQRHIKPAINIPVDELEVRAVNELSPSDLIVAYCGCEDDGDSKVARKILYAQGFRRVVILHDETAKEACATCK